MAKELILIRHGALDLRYSNCFIGKTDVSLSEFGRKQAEAISGPISRLKAAHFIASPLRRTCETAQIALIPSGQHFDQDPDLREIDFGAWEQKAFTEINASASASVANWSNFDDNFMFPEGEALQSFIQRVSRFAKRAAGDPAKTVVAVTHGGVIRFLICHLLGLPLRHYLLFDVQYASICAIRLYDQGGVLTRLNDICHLEACCHG